MGRIKTQFAIAAAVCGIIELLGALGCMVAAFFFSSKAQDGELYSKYYHTSETRKAVTNAAIYWWGGVPFLLPGILGIATLFNKHVVVMVFYMITNLISFFCGIALAIVVGIFYALWTIPVKAYSNGKCSFQYDQNQQARHRTYCECEFSGDDVKTLDSDRMRVYVQGCYEIEELNTILTTIIVLSCVTAFLALICSYVGCVSLGRQDTGVPRKKGYNPAPFVQQTQHPYNPPPQQQQPLIGYQPQPQPKQPDVYRPPPYQSEAAELPKKEPPREQKPVADEPAGGDWL